MPVLGGSGCGRGSRTEGDELLCPRHSARMRGSIGRGHVPRLVGVERKFGFDRQSDGRRTEVSAAARSGVERKALWLYTCGSRSGDMARPSRGGTGKTRESSGRRGHPQRCAHERRESNGRSCGRRCSSRGSCGSRRRKKVGVNGSRAEGVDERAGRSGSRTEEVLPHERCLGSRIGSVGTNHVSWESTEDRVPGDEGVGRKSSTYGTWGSTEVEVDPGVTWGSNRKPGGLGVGNGSGSLWTIGSRTEVTTRCSAGVDGRRGKLVAGESNGRTNASGSLDAWESNGRRC